jgi:hypothetical protein
VLVTFEIGLNVMDLTATNALANLNYTSVNGEPMRLMYSMFNNPARSCSDKANVFIKVRWFGLTAEKHRRLSSILIGFKITTTPDTYIL